MCPHCTPAHRQSNIAGVTANEATEGGPRLAHATRVTSPSVVRRKEKRSRMSWLWIVVIVAVLLAVFGYFGRGRLSN